MSNPIIELRLRAHTLLQSWNAYRAAASFEHFVEFAVTLSNMSELLDTLSLSGLLRLSKNLEQQALPLFGDENSHPVTCDEQELLDLAVRQLCHDIEHALTPHTVPKPERRQSSARLQTPDLPARRDVLLVSMHPELWQDLVTQLGYFGLCVSLQNWEQETDPSGGIPLLLLDVDNLPQEQWPARIGALRASFKTSQLLGLSVEPGFETLITALRAGCDACLPAATAMTAIVAQILEMNGTQEQEAFRVLIVEDSLTAIKAIERVLTEQKILTRAVSKPHTLLPVLEEFQPDLILMDMYMPDCTGVEAARVIRQYKQYLSIPIVYLSGETDIALQVEALRLGGDHFLTKPCNPVFLNAVVNSKIERYRALRRSMYHDSLTGLLNHTSTKQAVRQALQQAQRHQQPMTVLMLDIDHFKQVNDRFGHAAGDQIIRSLAWLLRQRVRKSDIVGRYGGEEFLVALPNASAQQALRIVDKIRQDFHEIRHRYLDSQFQVSFSGGLACCTGARSTAFTEAESLIHAADTALYEAKRGGRNRLAQFG